MDYPKLTIVTPVFNQVKFLEETILSILNQNYPNLEYIIIDGGSTDGTVDIIKKYESQLTYWVSEPDKGMYDALQKGFDHSTGEIMGWLNADDLYFNGCFFLLSKLFVQHKEINWVTGTSHILNSEGVFIGNSPSRKFCKYQFLIGDYKWIAQESTFWRRSLWGKTGSRLNTNLKYAGDFELWLRFIQCDTLYHLGLPVGIFRQQPGQLSSNMMQYEEEVQTIYKKLQISDKDRMVINLYRKKKHIANLINKTKIINGNKIVRLNTFEGKYMSVPRRIAYSANTDSFIFSDED